MEDQRTCSFYDGKSLGEIIAEKNRKSSQELRHLQEQAASQTFRTVGELIQDFLNGEIKFVAREKISVNGDPGKILELCQKEGLSIQDIKLKGKPLDQVLSVCRELIADLSYLLLKSAVVPQRVTYVAPGYKGITSVIDLKEMSRRFPDFKDWVAVGNTLPGEDVMCPAVIVAVDVVVVILDVVTVVYDKPIDLITRERAQ
jgi:hypothetical protein